MKIFFFLVAFCLVLLSAYFTWAGHNPSTGLEGSIVIENGNYLEQVKWSGKILLSDDEKSIKAIAPGGYLKFRENDAKMTAESNLKGDIHYELYDGHNELPLDDSGKNFIRAAIKKMIGRGFYAEGRAKSIYQKGGYRALIAELPNLQMENIRSPYFDLIFKNDSLSAIELRNVIIQTTNSVSDIDKENFLRKITSQQRKDSLVSSAWLDVIPHINSDIQKAHLLSLVIEQDSLSERMFDRIIDITTHLNSDLDKISILSKLIIKTENYYSGWSKILDVANHFNSDLDKQNIYVKLIARKNISEEQWITVINSASQQNSDLDKSNLLIRISKEMPLSENIKTAYLAAAKKISNDGDYGRTVKQIQ